MTPVLGSVGELYREGIIDTGKEAEFLVFASFLVTFAFIRTSAHMIRAQVSWWPGNVTVGGTHIHHLVWGILLLLIFGWLEIAVNPESPFHQVSAVMFGIGAGLTLDEFALWLNLKDVYWEKQGRASIDAVMIAIGVSGIFLIGFSGWVEAADTVETEVFSAVGASGILGIVWAFINAAKEKFGMALLGFVIPLVHPIGAFRLAKPNSVWAKLFYRDRKKRRLSRERFAGDRGKPFWNRGGELLRRLRLRVAGT
ncbi:MAG: hypothetical protein ACRDKH_01060 [Solirubrobacterales bacterium]